MRKLPDISEMEHITSKEFGEHMDTIIDRVTREDIALAIDHEDKSFVICPASWFDLPEMKHVENMLKTAVKYAKVMEENDLKETIETIQEFSCFASEDCLHKLLAIALERQADSTNSLGVELVATLKEALETVKKKE